MPIKVKLDGAVALPFASGAGQKAWQGGVACMDTAAYTIKPAVSGNANLVAIGEFAQSYDNSTGTGTIYVLVELAKEVPVDWYDNASGGAAVANLFTICYQLDDHTVTNSSTGNSVAGRVWKLDTTKGVLVQKQWGV
jgi:hypothetical protein